ncbi:cytochrome P450 2C8-like [Rana temporaria]|uniref:cytochrome P450 2C8-like n=1 Tax=Rana temporaria TaxID=8407 RepID=UPI001AAE04B7|nr:cytochrome P450 2C8-like [Rana temporaria]XP_040179146.1 cytochrome P450 2C8-like [Rana temporaria]
MDSSTLILALCFACLIFFLLRNRNKKYENLPPGPSPLPLLGNVLQLNMKDLPKSFIKLAKIHGDVFTVHLGRNAVVVLHGYDAVKEALVDNSDIFGDRAKLPAGQLVFKDYGVMLSNGERWRQLRRFSLTTLRNFGMGKRSVEERIQEESRCLVEELRKKAGSPFDPTYLVTLAVSNVICSIIFGQRFDYEDKNFLGLFAMLKKAFRIRNSFVGQLLNSFPKIMHQLPGPHHQVIQNFFTLNEFVMDKVKEHQKTLDQNCPRDYIDCFLIKMEQEKDNPTTEFVFQNLSVTVINIFLAGTETTSTTIRLGLRILLKYPDVLAKVQEEIDYVIGQNRCPSVEDRSKMPYTDAVIHEIQRITDVLPMSVPHATAQTIVFRGYTIPKGTTIFPLLTSVLKDPKYFQNPHKFNPNNFLDEKGGFRKKEAFIPFSTGKRMCLGEGMARMELFLFITTILQNFHLQSDEDPSDIDISPLPDSNSTVHRPYDICLVPR